jgi:hypothetical protein
MLKAFNQNTDLPGVHPRACSTSASTFLSIGVALQYRLACDRKDRKTRKKITVVVARAAKVKLANPRIEMRVDIILLKEELTLKGMATETQDDISCRVAPGEVKTLYICRSDNSGSLSTC